MVLRRRQQEVEGIENKRETRMKGQESLVTTTAQECSGPFYVKLVWPERSSHSIDRERRG